MYFTFVIVKQNKYVSKSYLKTMYYILYFAVKHLIKITLCNAKYVEYFVSIFNKR